MVHDLIEGNVFRPRNMALCKFTRRPHVQNDLVGFRGLGGAVEFVNREGFHFPKPIMTGLGECNKMFVISAYLWQFHEPMTELNEALIRKVAELSRLKLDEGEIPGYVTSIGEILNHVDQLRRVDTQGVEPMFYGIDDSLRLREDEVRSFAPGKDAQPRILESAPSVEDGGFKVPQIVG